MKPLIETTGLKTALRRPSGLILVAVNLSLIAGVVAWDWSVFDIVFLYWVENLAIGAINVLRMAASDPAANPSSDRVSIRGRRFPAPTARVDFSRTANIGFKLFIIPFFIVHYGGFCYAHGVFVVALFGGQGLSGNALSLARAGELLTPPLWWAVSLLTASHLFSFIRNFMLGGEFRRANAAMLMMRPYGRIVALHITILFGAFLTEILGSPLGLLIVLVVMKTGADLALHQHERTRLAKA